MINQGGMVTLLVMLLIGWSGPAYTQNPSPGAQPPAAMVKPSMVIKTQLFRSHERDGRTVELIGRKGNDIFFRIPGVSQAAGQATININTITKAVFEFQYDEFAVFPHVKKRRWADAAKVIIKAIAPTIPYLDLSTNNAVEPALEAAGYLFKSGTVLQQNGGATNEKAAAAAYAQAYNIFQQVGAAQWFERANNARLKAIQCLVAMGKLETAADEFSKLQVCEEIGDSDYGLYWLVQADILYQQKDYRAAIDAAVKSLVFNNKDMETFPDALLLSANCYYALQEMHQARDVYYEIVRLFEQTDWSAMARKQLVLMMKNNLTRGKERANYWKTLIDVKEDMNKLVEEYLKTTEISSVTNATTNAISQEGKTTP